MKNTIYILLSLLLFMSCKEPEYESIGKEIVDGKVSATAPGTVGRFSTLPRIWVQTPKIVTEVEIPFEYENRWKVGDSCLLIIEKYKIKQKND